MRKAATMIGVVLLALAGVLVAGALTVSDAAATGCNKPNPPEHCNPPTTTTPTTTPTTTTPSDSPCDPANPDGSPGGKDGKPGNDDCAADDPPPPPPLVTPPPPPVPPVDTRQCKPGQTEVERTPTSLTCSETKVITKTITKPGKKPKPKIVVKVKRVKYCPAPKPCPKGYVKSPDGRCSPQGSG